MAYEYQNQLLLPLKQILASSFPPSEASLHFSPSRPIRLPRRRPPRLQHLIGQPFYLSDASSLIADSPFPFTCLLPLPDHPFLLLVPLLFCLHPSQSSQSFFSETSPIPLLAFSYLTRVNPFSLHRSSSLTRPTLPLLNPPFPSYTCPSISSPAPSFPSHLGEQVNEGGSKEQTNVDGIRPRRRSTFTEQKN